MITVSFEIDQEKVTKVMFDTGELTGFEKPATLKAALEELTVENTVVTFSKMHKDFRIYENFNESEVNAIADACNKLSCLWQYEFVLNPECDDMCAQMTPLQLLANAMNMILEQQEIIDYLTNKNKGKRK